MPSLKTACERMRYWCDEGNLDWVQIASVSGVAAVLSILTSIAGLPEVEDGE